jgi:hypothetical protein
MFPVKPLKLVRVMVDVPEVSCLIVKDVGLAERVKSGDGGDGKPMVICVVPERKAGGFSEPWTI